MRRGYDDTRGSYVGSRRGDKKSGSAGRVRPIYSIVMRRWRMALALALLAPLDVARGAVSPSIGAAAVGADQRATRPPARRTTTDVTCTADLGLGAKSSRRFCDVFIVTPGSESVAMAIPPHTGAATLRFDLHNRFTVPPGPPDPGRAFARHTAVIAVLRSTGETIARAAVEAEFRTVQDLFDRIRGAGPGGLKAVAPGQPQAYEVTIPSTVTAIRLAGLRVDVLSRAGRAAHDQIGLPVAIVSNLRIEYTPR
jgi:hypothetical protein